MLLRFFWLFWILPSLFSLTSTANKIADAFPVFLTLLSLIHDSSAAAATPIHFCFQFSAPLIIVFCPFWALSFHLNIQFSYAFQTNLPFGLYIKRFWSQFFLSVFNSSNSKLSFLIRHFSRFSFILPAKGKEVNWLVWNFVLNCWSLLSFFKNIKATRRHTSSSPRFNLFKRHDFWFSLSIIHNTQTWNFFFLNDHLLLSNTDFLF